MKSPINGSPSLSTPNATASATKPFKPKQIKPKPAFPHDCSCSREATKRQADSCSLRTTFAALESPPKGALALLINDDHQTDGFDCATRARGGRYVYNIRACQLSCGSRIAGTTAHR